MRSSGILVAVALIATAACGGEGNANNGATADAPSGAAAPALDTTGGGTSGASGAAPTPAAPGGATMGDSSTAATPAPAGTDSAAAPAPTP